MRRFSAARAVCCSPAMNSSSWSGSPAPILMRCLTLPVYVVALTALWKGCARGRCRGRISGAGLLPVHADDPRQLSEPLRDGLAGARVRAGLLPPALVAGAGVAQGFGRTAGQLLVIGGLVQLFLALTDAACQPAIALRWLLVLPLLALADALATEVMAGLYIRVGKSDSLRFVVAKSLLALGGGLYPLFGQGRGGFGWMRCLQSRNSSSSQPISVCTATPTAWRPGSGSCVWRAGWLCSRSPRTRRFWLAWRGGGGRMRLR